MATKQQLAQPIYDKPRVWISDRRAEGKEWSFIENLGQGTTSAATQFLPMMVAANGWPQMEMSDWLTLVQLRKDSENQTLSFANLISSADTKNGAAIPTGNEDSWPKYKEMLRVESHFRQETIDAIEKSTHKILNELKAKTPIGKPVKGLVIGNVQSGKTANMAALMAMAADCGWNMFIILSGTIENLRVQTYERLLHDLNYKNTNWACIEHPQKSDMSKNSVSYHFEQSSPLRYFTVCLKQSSRLKSLIQWLQCNNAKYGQMRILIIDDESDQAGINTADENAGKCTTISGLIGNLILGLDEKGKTINTQPLAVNYIGYTATPYANILNSGKMKSLYPKDFICTLSVSDEYFGPQQIFGQQNGRFKGLDIIREISAQDIADIKEIHSGNKRDLPKSLEDSICWFLCCLAQMRVRNFKKPISLLIHTHQKTESHAYIAESLAGWFESTSVATILHKCEYLWNTEKSRFNKDAFRRDYPNYAVSQNEIADYLDFRSIEPEITRVLNMQKPLQHIQIDATGDIQYSEAIHFCIDNSTQNAKKNDTENIRLLYPKQKLDFASAFIVIGGATLSRGLTIEGLVSTYFLRTVNQSDTLMQMGRWFGYRRDYEMLPRIWMSTDTREKFAYLSELDQTLRDEIADMETLGEKPTEYGAKILMSDNPGKIKITGNKRMQAAVAATMNYMGAYSQTTLFRNDIQELSDNLNITKLFLDSLPSPIDLGSNTHALPDYVWKNVSFDRIKVYLEQFHFVSRQKFFGNINSVMEWVKNSQLGSWNVIVANLDNPQNGTIDFGFGKVAKVNRAKLANSNTQGNEIDIKALRAPKDLMADADLTMPCNLTAQEIAEIKRNDTKNIKPIRAKLGLDKTPQLIIYFIDKDSVPLRNSSGRLPLNAVEDIVGLCVNIPGERTPNNSFTESVSIDLTKVES